MSGEATPAQIGALLMAMRVRGETVPELTGAVRAMRARMTAVAAPPDAIDVCGTGGDAAGTLNVSTAVTFVVAGCDVPVAKHGNRALSSRTGGADVLDRAGRECRRAAGAAAGYPARGELRLPVRAAPPSVDAARRRARGWNSARGRSSTCWDRWPIRRGCAGSSPACSRPSGPRPMAETLGRLGSETAWIVHGQGLDELTVAGREPGGRAGRTAAMRRFTVEPGRRGPATRAGRGDPRRRCGAERRDAAGIAAGCRRRHTATRCC